MITVDNMWFHLFVYRARRQLIENIKQVENWNEFKTELDAKNLLLSPFCGESACEDNIKQDSAR